MSDVSITFPTWMVAWFLLGQAAPVTTLGIIGLGAGLLFGRGTRRVGLLRCLKCALAIVVTVWVAGISYWAFGLADRIMTDIYRARHHYRLAKATIMAGIELPQGSGVFVDEKGRLLRDRSQSGRERIDRRRVVAGRDPPDPRDSTHGFRSRDRQECHPCRRRRHSRDTLPRRKARRVHGVWR